MKIKIAHPHKVARQLYRFAWHRQMIHTGKNIQVKHRYSFDELDEQTQKAWLDLAKFVLRNGRHDHRDWK